MYWKEEAKFESIKQYKPIDDDVLTRSSLRLTRTVHASCSSTNIKKKKKVVSSYGVKRD